MLLRTECASILRRLNKYVGAPYLWGGKGILMWSPGGLVARPDTNVAMYAFDCAGLVACVLREERIWPDRRAVWAAQQMYEQTEPANADNIRDIVHLRFYGTFPGNITHVAFGIGSCHHADEQVIIEAAGGDSTTKTLEAANRRGANVRVAFEHRKDLVGLRSLHLKADR